MNKILLAINGLLVLAVVYLFIKVESNSKLSVEQKTAQIANKKDSVKTPDVKIESVATPPTGKIAYVNIDVLNEKCEQMLDLMKEAKSRKTSIESAVQALSENYQKKVMEYQNNAKAGIMPQSELESKAREIQQLEKDAQNKQIQMDNLTSYIAERNQEFQHTVKEFLQKWNNGRYDFIMSYSETVPTILLGNGSLDVTTEVVEKLNQNYKAIKTTTKK
ncbi:MAG: OmpH family outer membrane protein [Bacteroidetes bacterium]|nr:OmpH family outer membrane protein [Bacteroidota bacterium]